jgi:hypothetical protein
MELAALGRIGQRRPAGGAFIGMSVFLAKIRFIGDGSFRRLCKLSAAGTAELGAFVIFVSAGAAFHV